MTLYNPINLICYYIYLKGKKILKHRELQQYRKVAQIGNNSKITGGSINNNQAQSAIRIGDNTIVRGELLTFGHGGDISVGDYSYIGERTKVWSAKKISIGNRVLIAHNVNIHDQNSHPLDSNERHLDQKHIMENGFRKENNLNERPIIIEDDVWIGYNSTIMKGVHIGRGAIIGANSVITKNIEPYTVVVNSFENKIIKSTT